MSGALYQQYADAYDAAYGPNKREHDNVGEAYEQYKVAYQKTYGTDPPRPKINVSPEGYTTIRR